MSLFKRKWCALPVTVVRGEGTRETETVTFKGKIFQWWGFLALYLMSTFPNLSTCGFTETFRREDRGNEQHMHELFPVAVKKRVLDARPGWWGSSKSCGIQSVTPLELWQEAVGGGTRCTYVHEPNQSPVAVNFLPFKLCHLQTSFKWHTKLHFFYTHNNYCPIHITFWTFSVINSARIFFFLFYTVNILDFTSEKHAQFHRGVISAWLFTIPVLYPFLSIHFG